MSFESSIKNFIHHDPPKDPAEHKPHEMKPTEVSIAEVPDNTPIAVRNCSTRRVMEQLLNRLSLPAEGDHIDGRYLKIGVNDVPAFQDFASSGGFHVEDHRLPGIIVFDLMVDNENRTHHRNGGRK